MNPGGSFIRCSADADFEATPPPPGTRYPEPGEVRWLMGVADRAIPGTRGSAGTATRALRVMRMFVRLMAENEFFMEGV